MTVTNIQQVITVSTECQRQGLRLETDYAHVYIANKEGKSVFVTHSMAPCKAFMQGYLNGVWKPKTDCGHRFYVTFDTEWSILDAIKKIPKIANQSGLSYVGMDDQGLHTLEQTDGPMVAFRGNTIQKCFGFLYGYMYGLSLPATKVEL